MAELYENNVVVTEEDDNSFYSEENLATIENKKPLSEEEEIVDEESMAKTYSLDPSELGMDDLVLEDDDSEDDVLAPEERLRMFADSIMSCCVGEKDIKNYALDKLMLVSSPQLFRDENYVLFTILYTYRGKLKQIKIDEEFLKLFLNRNRGLLQKARGFIDINAYGEIDGSVELGYISGVLKHFKRLVSMDELTITDFETCFEKYLIEFKAIEAEKTYNQASMILTDGLNIGRKKYFGFEDSANFTKRRMAEIEGLVNMQKGSGFVTAREMLLEEKEGNKSYKISDFDKLEALNKVYGGIYTGMFYQVIAPPKTGKSKFCARVVHTTAVKYGNNVTVWAEEGGKEAFLAQLRAIHFDYTYNTGVSVTEKKFGVSQDAIVHNKFPSDELKQLELSSKIDFASNQDYGSIDFIDRPFEVETFLEDIDTSVKSNNSQLIVIDYLQIIGSAKNLPERERVAEAYRRLLDYCKTNNVAVLTPGQYKQDAFEKLLSMGNTADADMRTSGGTSSEVIRTPDIIFAFWATTQDIINNIMKILSMPCRFNKPFPEIPVAIDFESCQFVSTD